MLSFDMMDADCTIVLIAHVTGRGWGPGAHGRGRGCEGAPSNLRIARPLSGNGSVRMADRTVRYGLRARLSARSQAGSKRLAQDEIEDPAAAAVIEAGLRVTGLSKAELKAFAARSQDYLECRHAQQGICAQSACV